MKIDNAIMIQPSPFSLNGKPARVSAHGGHSGDYCQHARDSLDEIVEAYHARNFAWVGVTEHIPAVDDRFLYPDERSAGWTSRTLQERFTRYMTHCRNLQAAYRGRMPIYVGMETEAYSGAIDYAISLRNDLQPDYMVGSVHHVADIPIDMNMDEYARAISDCGGMMALYTAYFDLQYEMIQRLKPDVVGHFDLIRIFDPDYPARLKTRPIWERICRNLECIAALGLKLDVNVRALVKGGYEPYPSRPILEKARDLGISVLPGDDSHSVDTVGAHIDEGIQFIQSIGLSTQWTSPIKTINTITL
jgi:histidinol-phosphatase (PHP family)